MFGVILCPGQGDWGVRFKNLYIFAAGLRSGLGLG